MSADKPVASAEANGSDAADLAKVPMHPAGCKYLDAILTASGLPRASQGRADSSSTREPTYGNGSEDRSNAGRSGKE